MGYSAAHVPPPPPRCCRDEMVALERLEPRLWGLWWPRRVITAWCCVWCERVVDAGEPERQQLASWVAPVVALVTRLPPSGQPWPEPPPVRPRGLCTRCSGAGPHPAAVHDLAAPPLPYARN